jgi:signal peptidase
MKIQRTLRRAPAVGVNVLLVITVLAGLVWLGSGPAGFQHYVITGGSMSGTIDKGSVVFEREVDVQDLRVGDIITYQPPASSGVHSLVTHRVVSIQPGRDSSLVLRTRGDANGDVDPWAFSIDQGSVPVVTYSFPVVGKALIALANPDFRRLALGVPALLIALFAAAELVRSIRRPRPIAF